jgi:uncharacterized protein (UPF0333 family)
MKSSQRGAVSGSLIAIIAIVIMAAIAAMMLISAANYGNRTEVALRAKLQNNENIYGQGTQKIIEIAQVPAMYVDAVSKVTKEAIGGRYGAEGSKAVFQMLREQNPQIDPAMFAKIQQVIESFRTEFQRSQTELVDMRRSYETKLGNFPDSLFLSVVGYPKADLSKYDIVTTDKAAKTFETKRDTGIQLRPAN